jgi:hypothetical protein
MMQLTYTPLLLSVSRLDDNAGDDANKKAEAVRAQIKSGQWATAQGSWNDLLQFIGSKSGDVVSTVVVVLLVDSHTPRMHLLAVPWYFVLTRDTTGISTCFLLP